MEIVEYNIAIAPPKEIADCAMEMSRIIGSAETHFVLDGACFYPHITLYNVAVDDAGLHLACEYIDHVAASVAPFPLSFQEYVHYPGAWVAARYHRNEAIDYLHQQLVERLNPIRTRIVDEADIRSRPDLSDTDRANILEYGHAMLLSQFDPHLTLSRLKEASPNIPDTLPPRSWDFLAECLVLFRSGPHGVCMQPVCEWWLA